MDYFQALILAIIEGITEFLPISSTGHMVIAESLMGLLGEDGQEKEFVKLFTVAIQFGAILSVIVLYWKRFFQSIDFYFKLALGAFPILILGFLLKDAIDQFLESPISIGVMLVLGGIFFLFLDRIFPENDIIYDDDGKPHDQDITYPRAAIIGGFQCLGLMPGVSRSASTIVGGLFQGLTKKTAAEFSFFLAVPTMAAATLYKLYDGRDSLTSDTLPILLFGNVVAFIVALLAIKFFVSYVAKHGFKMFGYYRIILGLAVVGYFSFLN